MSHLLDNTGIENTTGAAALARLSRSDKAKERRAGEASKTFQYGQKNWRDPDWMFDTIPHAQAVTWLEALEAAPPEMIREWDKGFLANMRTRLTEAEDRGQTESVFTGKMLVLMNILMERIGHRVAEKLTDQFKGTDE